MPIKLVFIHTLPSILNHFSELSKELLQDDVEIFHIVDEILLKTILEEKGLSPFIYRRLAENVISAEHAGANIVQLTCSSISPCADIVKMMVKIPVLKIDEPMIDHAITLGNQIGIIATAPTTLKPTTELVYDRARYYKKQVSVNSILCEDAYSALFSGDVQTHDCIVRQNIVNLMSSNNVVVLAQASMAKVIETIPAEERVVPILSSPRFALEHLQDVIQQMVTE